MSSAVVFGGTGLVGNHLLKILINDDYYSKVKVFTRSKIEIIHHKLEIIETNFENIESLKDKISADKAAVDAMRSELNNIDMKGEIVIGEGELDEAPMLYIGETIGTKKGPEFDIAVDPLEGTNFAANNLPGALSVIAVARKSNLFNAPETYMDKISTNIKEPNVIDLDYSVKKNIYNLKNNIEILAKNNRKKFLAFIKIHEGNIIERIYYYFISGIYRQSNIQNLALFFAAILKKV